MSNPKYVIRARDFNPYVLYFKRWSPDGRLANWTRNADSAAVFGNKEQAAKWQDKHGMKETTSVVLLPAKPL